MILERELPRALQFQPEKKVLDDSIVKAKMALLNDIKRSIYLYRVDCGGCNGCEIEIFSSITPVFDVERFGIKNTPSPRHADILVYTGAMTRSMRMPAIRAYQGAPDPKLVVSYGACGCTGGIFHDNYCVWGGTDKLFPVDVYIPGCPPSPPQTIYGFAIALGLLAQKLHHTELIEGEGEQVEFRFADIPYKLRVALERKARLLAGYRAGQELADEFMAALMAEGQDPAINIKMLISRQGDPRRKEILEWLLAELAKMVDGLGLGSALASAGKGDGSLALGQGNGSAGLIMPQKSSEKGRGSVPMPRNR